MFKWFIIKRPAYYYASKIVFGNEKTRVLVVSATNFTFSNN